MAYRTVDLEQLRNLLEAAREQLERLQQSQLSDEILSSLEAELDNSQNPRKEEQRRQLRESVYPHSIDAGDISVNSPPKNSAKELADVYSRQLANMNSAMRMLINDRNHLRKLYHDSLHELEEYKKEQEQRLEDTFSSIADKTKKENGRLAETLNIMRQELRRKTEELRATRNAN
eukprot:jgi/Galph1/2140/GphlegSOOS_G796.1